MKEYRVNVENCNAGVPSGLPFTSYGAAKSHAKSIKHDFRYGAKVFILESVNGGEFHLLEEVRSNILEDRDIALIKTNYENAKHDAKEYRKSGDPEWRVEFGKAEALESVLRLLDYDYTEISSGLFMQELEKIGGAV